MNARDLGLLVLRLGLGVVMVAHGSQKAFGAFGGRGMEAFTAGIESMGIPALFAWLAMLSELAGGLAVILGAFTRIAALMIAVTMTVAIVRVGLPRGFFANSPGGAGIEFPLALLTLAVALVLLGPGRLCLIDRER